MSINTSKSASEIIVETINKKIAEKGVLPWMRPYKSYSAFNWVTMTPYRGINRIMLEDGEYLTMNQINAYNKKNKTHFRAPNLSSNLWEMIVFFKSQEYFIDSDEELGQWVEGVTSCNDFKKKNEIVVSKGWVISVAKVNGVLRIVRRRNVLRYSWVIERSNIVDTETGAKLPSRFATNEVSITLSKPSEVFKNYCEREKIAVRNTGEVPKYLTRKNTILLNRNVVNEGYFWQVAFHELAHSTGEPNRLNRDYFKVAYDPDLDRKKLEEERTKEECIAEITSSMLCSECGISEFGIEGSEFDNIAAYVAYWSGKVRDWGTAFIWVASEAEKAFDYIMGNK